MRAAVGQTAWFASNRGPVWRLSVARSRLSTRNAMATAHPAGARPGNGPASQHLAGFRTVEHDQPNHLHVDGMQFAVGFL
jgi:hypothetical protein